MLEAQESILYLRNDCSRQILILKENTSYFCYIAMNQSLGKTSARFTPDQSHKNYW